MACGASLKPSYVVVVTTILKLTYSRTSISQLEYCRIVDGGGGMPLPGVYLRILLLPFIGVDVDAIVAKQESFRWGLVGCGLAF